MSYKLVDRLLLVANLGFLLGIVVTILIINQQTSISLNTIGKHQYPFIIGLVWSFVMGGIFVFHRMHYYTLIYQHLSQKALVLYKLSIFFLVFNLLVGLFMFYGGFGLLASNNTDQINFFTNGYLYIFLGIELVLTFIDIILDVVAQLKVKIDLALKRGGVEAFQASLQSK